MMLHCSICQSNTIWQLLDVQSKDLKKTQTLHSIKSKRNTVMKHNLCQLPLAPEENPRMFPTAIQQQNMAFAEFL